MHVSKLQFKKERKGEKNGKKDKENIKQVELRKVIIINYFKHIHTNTNINDGERKSIKRERERKKEI